MKVLKNALIVELKKPTLPENSVLIENIIYWNIYTQIFEEQEEYLWYEVSQMELDENLLGLKEICCETDSPHRFFEVIDKQKYLWAKLKYGI